MAKLLQENNVYVTPVWKFCSKCYKKAVETDEDFSSQEEWESKSEKKIKFDTSIKLLGISPVKLKSVPKHNKIPAAKQKFEDTIDRVVKMVSLKYNIEEASLTAETNSTIFNKKDHDLDILMYELNHGHVKRYQITFKCLSILFELQDKLKMSKGFYHCQEKTLETLFHQKQSN